jgi:hypothetical protein
MPIELVRVGQEHLADVERQIKAKDLGVSTEDLSDGEVKLFSSFFNKMLSLHLNERRWIDFHLEHMGDYLTGLLVAKKQFGGIKFGGALPGPGEFGIDQWRAGYCNVGQDWNREGVTTARTAKNWIHEGGALLAGTAGDNIRFLDGIVGVISGFGDLRYQIYGLHSEIECFQLRVGTRTLKPIYVGQNFKLADFPIMGLDEPILVKDRSQIRVQYITEVASTNAPFLVGVVFGLEGSLNHLVATALDGTSNKLYESV